MTTIRLVCPQCRAKLNAPAAAVGRRLPCPKCSAEVVVPNPADEHVLTLDDEGELSSHAAEQARTRGRIRRRRKARRNRVWNWLLALFALPPVLLFLSVGLYLMFKPDPATAERPYVAPPPGEKPRPVQPSPSPPPAEPVRKPEPTLRSGATATIRSDGQPAVFAAADDVSNDALNRFCNARDEAGVRGLVAVGKVFVVPVGTKVRVIRARVTTTEVRILEGEHEGKEVIVAFEFLKAAD